ncbi:MAG: nucleotide sugar dehydrogenase [Candidatus Omnitrophica bacterium]|nr:nucleotide sugar dehydrogenase [Candidatus Omnitrophota bacterium]
MGIYKSLRKKVTDKTAVITVVGLGYVGLPMAIAFAKKGYKVNGFDTSTKRIDNLHKGISYINDVSSGEIREVVKSGRFHVSGEETILSGSDVLIICVPTPLRKTKVPNISYVVQASRTVARYLRRGQMIILESTTYPGTTRDVILTILRKTGLALDKDFFLSFSPERIDPGNPDYDFTNIPKVLGSFTEDGRKLGKELYSKVIKTVVDVSSPEVAEVTKLLENTFRIVNIGLINEFSHLCHKLGIDVWEVIEAAKTKPFGFMPFYPGPGIGGHCIPKDPVYLSWKARKVGFETRLIDIAAEVNRNVPTHMVERIITILGKYGKKVHGSKVLILGVTYKKDVNDLRESPALDIIKLLAKKGADISYHDPYIPYLDIGGIRSESIVLSKKTLRTFDIAVITADHSSLNYKEIVDCSNLIFDTRNILTKLNLTGKKTVRL